MDTAQAQGFGGHECYDEKRFVDTNWMSLFPAMFAMTLQRHL